MKISTASQSSRHGGATGGRCARRSTRAWSLLLSAVALLVATTGCGNTLYLVQVNRAEERFEEARELGAEEHSTYEYYAAEARLEEAKVQAAQAEYGNASDLSDEATEYAEKAIINCKRARNFTARTPEEAEQAQEGVTQ